MAAAIAFASPLLVLASAVAVGFLALPYVAGDSERAVVAYALSLDLIVVVPVLVYLVFVHSGRAPWIVLVPTLAAAVAVASAIIPTANRELVDWSHWLLVPIEIGVVVWLAVVATRIAHDSSRSAGDFIDRFRVAARKHLWHRLAADILTTEVGLMYYAFARRQRAENSLSTFTVHRQTGYGTIAVAMLIILLIETVAVHVLLSQWSVLAAWILTLLSVYAIVWLVGDYRALEARPILLSADCLWLRIGMRWQAQIPREQVAQFETNMARRDPPATALNLSVLGQHNVCIRFRRPVEFSGLYGLRRQVDQVWLSVDEVERFRTQLVDCSVNSKSGTLDAS